MPKYVNADKLIARMREIADEKWNKRAAPACWSDAYEHFIDELEEADAEDVAPVIHAIWMMGYKYQPCSHCRYHGKKSYNFCPRCGAKMGEEAKP